MTDEEQQQVQNIITARTKLLTAKIQQQESKINSLNQELDAKQNELDEKNRQLDQLHADMIEIQEQLEANKSALADLQEKFERVSDSALPEPDSDSDSDSGSGFDSGFDDEPESEQEQAQIPEQDSKPLTYLQNLLQQHFDQKFFATGQEDLVQAILDSRDVLAIIPDESERILSFQLPAIINPAVTLVISPSLSSRKENPALPSVYIHSSLSPWQRTEIFERARKGAYKIIYTTPSQLAKDDFRKFVKQSDISRVIINSRWQANIADEFSRISRLINALSFQTAKRPPVAIFLDIAGVQIQNELANSLGLIEPYMFVSDLSSDFERANIFLDVANSENKLASICRIISERADSCGVIICDDVLKCEEILNELEQNSLLINPYTISNSEREILDDFNSAKSNILVTNHNSLQKVSRQDIRFMIHFEIPDSLENFYQDISRLNLRAKAEKSESVMLVSSDDLKNASANQSVMDFCKCEKCLRRFLLEYFGKIFDEDFRCDNCAYCQGSSFAEEPDAFDFGKANDSQRQAISTGEGPVLVIAGPGTGKTFTIIQRAAFLIQDRKVNPENIFIATFSEKAAMEMSAQIHAEFSKRKLQADAGKIIVSTIQDFCTKILLEHSDFKKRFRIISDFEQAYLIFRNIDRFDALDGIDLLFKTPASNSKWKRSQEICDYMRFLLGELIAPEELISDPDVAISAMGNVMRIYLEILGENNALNHELILFETYKLFTHNPEILDEIISRVTHIMIDDYQDTNYAQEQIMLMLAGDENNICVVGDDDQSVYGFKGAIVRNILDFPQKFPGSQCKIVHLTENYRSEKSIIEFCTNWIDSLKTWGNFRYSKKIEPRKKFVASGKSQNVCVMKISGFDAPDDWHEKILQFINTLHDSGKLQDYNQVAFLFRSVKDSRVQALSSFLEKNGVSVYSPLSNMYFKRVEIKFAIGCLLVMFQSYVNSLENGEFRLNGKDPEHVIYYRTCLNMVTHYVEKPSYAELSKFLRQTGDLIAKIPRKREVENLTFSDLLYKLFAFSPFKETLNVNLTDNARITRRAYNLAKFSEIIQDFEHEHNINNFHPKFLDNIAKSFFNTYLRFVRESGVPENIGVSHVKTPSGCVAFMDIRNSKGMEFPIVFVDSLWDVPQDDRKSNDMTMMRIEKKYFRHSNFEPYDQIRNFDFWRLYYTAFSRARDILILTCLCDKNSPGKCFRKIYNSLPDTHDKSFIITNLHLRNSKKLAFRKIYTFDDLRIFEDCPLQHKFFTELGFLHSRNNAQMFDLVIHDTLSEIHRKILDGNSNFINDANIQSMLDEKYESLSKSEHGHLSKLQRSQAVQEILRYAWQQQGTWRSVKDSDLPLELLGKNYAIRGKVDLLRAINNNDEDLEIMDFRSGSKPNININRDREKLEISRKQLNIYAHLLTQKFSQQNSNLRIKRMSLYYTGEENGSPIISFAYNNSETQQAIAFFDGMIAEIAKLSASGFSGVTDFAVCSKCDLKYYCGREKL